MIAPFCLRKESHNKMELSKRSLAIFCFFFFTFVFSLSVAHDTHKDYLAPHNKARAEVGVPPLTWSNTLAAYAQKYANSKIVGCKLEHSNGPYGENLAEAFGDEFPATDAVNLWIDEKKYYNHDTKTCEGGECRHYTQVVWRNTEQVGCAKVKCDNGWWFTSCNYDPPGNYIGESPY